MTQKAVRYSFSGFTLSELLIALAILGVIATFTIPKVLQSQQNQAWNAVGHEAIATISSAYAAYKQKNGNVPASMDAAALVPYMNYVRMDTTGQIDRTWGDGSVAQECSWSYCLLLHNGGRLYIDDDWTTFGNTSPTNYIYFLFDPDGKVTDGTTNGPGRGLEINLYYNGRIVSSAERKITDETSVNGTPTNYGPGGSPDWFKW